MCLCYDSWYGFSLTVSALVHGVIVLSCFPNLVCPKLPGLLAWDILIIQWNFHPLLKSSRLVSAWLTHTYYWTFLCIRLNLAFLSPPPLVAREPWGVVPPASHIRLSSVSPKVLSPRLPTPDWALWAPRCCPPGCPHQTELWAHCCWSQLTGRKEVGWSLPDDFIHPSYIVLSTLIVEGSQDCGHTGKSAGIQSMQFNMQFTSL